MSKTELRYCACGGVMWFMTRAPGRKDDEAATDTPVWWCTQCEAVEVVEDVQDALPPEGTAVEVVEGTDTLDDLSPEERAELMQVLDAGFDDIRAGRVVDGAEVIRRLLARNT